MAGFFDGLYENTQNPLFLGGIGLMTGGAPAMMQGMQTGAGLQDRIKKQKQQASFIDALKGMPGVDQNTMAMLAANPELGQQVAGNMISHRMDPMADIKMKAAELGLQKDQADLSLMPDRQRLLRAQADAAARGPEPKFMEVNGRIVQVGQNGAREIFDAGPKPQTPPVGYRFDPQKDGALSYIPGGPHDPTAHPNEMQAKSAGFAARMVEAERNLRGSLSGQDPVTKEAVPKFGATDWNANVANVFPEIIANQIRGTGHQISRQAAQEFITAQLRRESGASISPTEFEVGYQKYFPQPGDSEEVIKKKAETRATTIRAMAGETNGYFDAGSPAQSQLAKELGITGNVSKSPQGEAPQLAPDGNWYVKDPSRPGKFLKVQH